VSCGARVELPPILDAAVEVAADVVGVVTRQRRGVHGVAGQNPVAEAGREALDLRLDLGGHVGC
jgi:predicted amidohydrolase